MDGCALNRPATPPVQPAYNFDDDENDADDLASYASTSHSSLNDEDLDDFTEYLLYKLPDNPDQDSTTTSTATISSDVPASPFINLPPDLIHYLLLNFLPPSTVHPLSKTLLRLSTTPQRRNMIRVLTLKVGVPRSCARKAANLQFYVSMQGVLMSRSHRSLIILAQ